MRDLVARNLPEFVRPLWRRLIGSPLAYRLAKGTFWSLVGAVISRSLTLLSSIISARIIGKVAFGELGAIQSTVGMLSVFAGLSMGLTANKFVAELRTRDPERAGRIIGLSSLVAWGSGGLLAAAMMVLAPWLSNHSLAAPHLEPLLRVSSFLLLLGAVNGAQIGALSGFEAFKRIALVNLIGGLISFPLLVGGVLWLGLQGIVWGMVASQATTCLLTFFAVRKQASISQVPLGLKGAWSERSLLWRFSLPAVLSNVSTAPVYWICVTLLVNSAHGYPEMGVLNAANQWFNLLIFLPSVLGQAVMPMLSEQMGQKGPNKALYLMGLSMKLNAVISIPILLVGCLASPVIMGFYGDGFRAAWPTLVAVLWTAAVLAVQTPVGYAITAAGKMWTATLMNLGWGATFIIFTYLFLGWGAAGLATARLSAYVLHGIWTFAYAYYAIRSGEESQRTATA